MINQLPYLLIPVGILATIGATISSSPELTQYGETIGIVSILLYLIWDKNSECKQLREENRKLMEKLTGLNRDEEKSDTNKKQQ